MRLDDYLYKLYKEYDNLAIYYNKLTSYWENLQFYGRIKSIFRKSKPFFIIFLAISYFSIINFNLYFTAIKSALLFTVGISVTPFLIGTILDVVSRHYRKKELNSIINIVPTKTSLGRENNILECSILERCYSTRRNIMIDVQKKYNEMTKNNKGYKSNKRHKSNIVLDKLCLDNLENKLEKKLIELDYIEQKNELLTTKVLLDENYLFWKSLGATFKAGGIYFIYSYLILSFLYKTSVPGLFAGIDLTIPWFIGQCLAGIVGNILYNKSLDNKIKVFNFLNKDLKEYGIDISKSDFNLDREIRIDRTKVISEAVSLLVSINSLDKKISNSTNNKDREEYDYSYHFINGTRLNNSDIENMTYDRSKASTNLVRRRKIKYF